MLSADIAQMRQLVGTLNDVATQIDALDVRTVADTMAAALPGCPIPAACAQAGEFTEGAWLRVAQRIQQISTATTQCANNIQATDEDFQKALDTMRFQIPGAK
ncbi:hypothetical protein ACTWPB_08070 [Nocardia sp. IBHARD005]|uniref:hypothetical protein n=1 Tax=Nocardia sp. IBHARD005 TaxID=3457765 RepID=UPI004059E5CB